ncbi:MAG: glyS, partial [Francisellaceae bacterium]|nr:glyS [Francisellaceae bacterium]
MNYQNLLVEIGVEELPGSILPVILEQFTKTFISHLEKEFISISEYKGFITPRRIALVIYNFPLEIEAKTTIKKGPLVKSAFDINKNPSPALLGFIKSLNESLDNLKIQELEKGDFVYFEQKTSPLITEKMLPKIVSETLTHMHLPKRMFWGENAFSFVRPIQWITLLLEKKPILSEIYNIKTKGESFGHRFHHPYALSFPDPSEYESVLETEGYVIPDFDKRLRFIKEEMKRGALEKDFVVNENAKLLNEVTGLVEWPFILMGHFDEAFLELPPQVLITTLEHHQRCFTLKDKTSSKLVPYFIIIANIESKNPNSVIFHNEKVIHARLSDASFHYKQDLKTPLLNHIPNLKKVIFQQGLGSLYDKSLRISFLAEQIMALLAIEHSDIQKAALLIKADLLTNMVSEFPELQGSMGKYYALHEGYSLEIAESIEEHYLPLHAEGNLPVTNLGKILSICDKVDLLVGMFGLGKAPKSDKDPFGLRRAALGIMRILIESEYDIDLK